MEKTTAKIYCSGEFELIVIGDYGIAMFYSDKNFNKFIVDNNIVDNSDVVIDKNSWYIYFLNGGYKNYVDYDYDYDVDVIISENHLIYVDDNDCDMVIIPLKNYE